MYSRSEKHHTEKLTKQQYEILNRGKRVSAQKLKSCSIDSKKEEQPTVFGTNFNPVERGFQGQLVDHNKSKRRNLQVDKPMKSLPAKRRVQVF
jgi:hypothetical protein